MLIRVICGELYDLKDFFQRNSSALYTGDNGCFRHRYRGCGLYRVAYRIACLTVPDVLRILHSFGNGVEWNYCYIKIDEIRIVTIDSIYRAVIEVRAIFLCR